MVSPSRASENRDSANTRRAFHVSHWRCRVEEAPVARLLLLPLQALLAKWGRKKNTIARISAKILLKSLCSSEKRSVELSHRTTLDNPETSALNAAVWSSFKTDKK